MRHGGGPLSHGPILKRCGRVANAILRAANVRLVHPARPFDREGLPNSRVLPAATYSPWLADAPFLRLYERIQPNTLVDIYRCYELWQIAKQLDDVDGAFLEVGVWRGGTGAILAAARAPRTVYLADTFAGVVKAGPNDSSYSGGEHADATVADVRRLMDDLSLQNVKILPGVFPDETASEIPGAIALLHCDVDVYESTRDIVAWALPRLAVNGVLVFDDYGFIGTEGVTRFVNELRSRRDLFFVHNLNGHAVFVARTPPG